MVCGGVSGLSVFGPSTLCRAVRVTLYPVLRRMAACIRCSILSDAAFEACGVVSNEMLVARTCNRGVLWVIVINCSRRAAACTFGTTAVFLAVERGM